MKTVMKSLSDFFYIVESGPKIQSAAFLIVIK